MLKPTFALLCAVSMAGLLHAAEKPDPNVPTPEAKALMDQVNAAYDGVRSLKVAGTLSANLDVAGTKQDRALNFTGEYRAPGEYRHTVQDELVAGSTGQKLYLHEMKDNLYAITAVPEQPVSYRQLPGVVGQLMEMQDPMLLLAVSGNGVTDLIEGGKSVRVAEPAPAAEGQPVNTLQFTSSDGRQVALDFDPSTKLLRKATYDLSEMMRKRGAEQVNQALISIVYSDVQTGADFAGDYFAWTPPANARDVTDAVIAGISSDDTTTLIGQPAPEFKLATLDGKQVSLSDLKGKPVLLDFWATWCPPCVKALPEVAELYHEKKDSVHVFAVNVGEDRETIQTFLGAKKLDVPVLVDQQETTMTPYKIQGIPTTVLITPKGAIHKVFVGMPPGGKAELIRELDAAAKL